MLCIPKAVNTRVIYIDMENLWIRLDISASDYTNFLSHEHVLTVFSQTQN